MSALATILSQISSPTVGNPIGAVGQGMQAVAGIMSERQKQGLLAQQATQQAAKFKEETDQNKLIDMANDLNTALAVGRGVEQDNILKNALSKATPGTAPAISINAALSNPNPEEKEKLLKMMVDNAQQRGLLKPRPEATKTPEQIEREIKVKERQAEASGKTEDIKEFEYAEANPDFALKKREAEALSAIRKSAGKSFKNASDLRKEFISQSSDYQKVRDAYTRVSGSASNPSAAGDLSLIFNYMKMLDPGSVVRESEFATAAAAGSFGERIKAVAGKVAAGERLSEAMRKDFVDKSAVLMKGIENQHKKREKSYKEIATRNKLNPDEVVIDLTAPVNSDPLGIR